MLKENNAQISVLTSLSRYVFISSCYRKQHRLGRRRIGDGLELGIMTAERLRHFHFRSFQDADELQSVDDGFTLKVIVGHHKRFASPLRDFADARNPRSKFFSGVKIVVALMSGNRCVVAEPGIVAPSMKPHVRDSRGGLRGGPQGSADNGLIDVAETDPAGTQQLQR